MQPASPRAVLEAAESQWIFSKDEIRRTPSGLDGMPLETEQANRGKGVNFIIQVGIMLKLPQLTLSTASVFLHRFFMRRSMVDKPGRPGIHYYSAAATCIFLASKVEENCRKMKELIVACARVAQKNPQLAIDEQSKEYWRWRDTLLHNEDLLLETLCFDLSLEPPYKTLYSSLHRFSVQDNKPLRNAGWAYLNDSNVTMLCLLFTSRTIAASALYCAAKNTDTTFPDDERGRPWWEVLGVRLQDIRRACNYMAEIYENSPPPNSQAKYAYTPEEGDPADAKTRSRPLGLSVSPSPGLGMERTSNGGQPGPTYRRSPQSPRKRSHDSLENDDRRPRRRTPTAEVKGLSNSVSERPEPSPDGGNSSSYAKSPKRRKLAEPPTNGHRADRVVTPEKSPLRTEHHTGGDSESSEEGEVSDS
ncbi:MAG: hypothetical protein M1825_002254 [Sarcosagium campestre]|nr:MAG: hypothetical protein M1825_002254 [Sarcosagium campestre]